MELTKFQKAITLSAVISMLQKGDVETGLKSSEGLKMAAYVSEAVEHLNQTVQDVFIVEQLQQAARIIYDDLMKGETNNE